MKKIVLLTGIFLLLGTTSAGAWMYNTSCGRAVQTVSPDFFPTQEEADIFYAILDAEYCNGGDIEEEEDKKDVPSETPNP